ncbi:DUF378 domain-containing protein [Candidatus Peregrinibacteria bacterium]|jgi:uncharacterized membrane protein YuzA (DUF378 family)|nr:DUF378 domain-containing protein [Candidatus Peregrinibacteria bacterium]MBT3598643.1 DUF378 domain-containing protein [Candidatus Peregrinibacteria bacterium]MBT4367393.1 DUF378 domain-containing protein [Candidatus Peregrinibacteria bacterium]MBT4585751.1 DUF378 domain-containing protein [Candidatus Peregrinibacteria bacterium]MBT6730958.1 DUF378 domain-containing protein [Candidatus Peregrinibacteria bacterium]
MEKSLVRTVARILVFVGALNWGLVGLGMLMNTDLNVVSMTVGGIPFVSEIVYVLVGLSALYLAIPGKRK